MIIIIIRYFMSTKKNIILFIILLLASTLLLQAQTQNSFDVRSNLNYLLKYVEDPLNQFLPEEALNKIMKMGESAPDGIYMKHNKTIWIYFNDRDLSFSNRDSLYLEIGNYRIDEKELYMIDSDGNSTQLSEIPARVSGHRFPLYLLPERNTHEYILKLKTHAPMPAPLEIINELELRFSIRKASMVYSLILGVLISMFLYNLIVYYTLKDRIYQFYTLYICSMITYTLSLTGLHLPLFSMNWETGLIMLWITLGIVVFTSLLFVKKFLNTRENNPILHFLIAVVQADALLILIFGILKLNTLAHYTALFGGFGVSALGLTVGIRRYYQGYKPARYFLVAWTALLLGAMTLPMKDLGLVPQSLDGELWTGLGAAAESILLAFALTDRIRQLRLKTETLRESRDHFRKASLTDGLTGLFNTRFLHETLKIEIDNAVVNGDTLSVIMLDVDDFKIYNDTYGHKAGDIVLRRLAHVMRSSARGRDYSCRYGGEEFTVILPATDLDSAAKVAERIRNQFADNPPGIGEDIPGVSVSVGVAQFKLKETSDILIGRADKAMYQAKSKGKNRVELLR